MTTANTAKPARPTPNGRTGPALTLMSGFYEIL
jgi:hypothetical protein